MSPNDRLCWLVWKTERTLGGPGIHGLGGASNGATLAQVTCVRGCPHSIGTCALSAPWRTRWVAFPVGSAPAWSPRKSDPSSS